MFAKRGVAAFLSAVLAFGAVPPAAIAEGVAEVQTQSASIEYRINATDDNAPWVSLGSAAEAIEAAKKADEERAARAQEAEPAIEQAPSGESNAEQQNNAADVAANNEAVAEGEMASEDDESKTNEGEPQNENANAGVEAANEGVPEGAAPSEEPAQELEVSAFEARLAGVEGKVELLTRAADEAWPEDWPVAEDASKRRGGRSQQHGLACGRPAGASSYQAGVRAVCKHKVWNRGGACPCGCQPNEPIRQQGRLLKPGVRCQLQHYGR